VTNVSVQYDRTSQTITCTSTGGPATDVIWSKDNILNIGLTMGGLYENSQIIINTSSATYENRLRIVEKSSKAAGNYTCKITNPRGSINGSIYIQGKEHIKSSCN
jgi:ribosome recycling factor